MLTGFFPFDHAQAGGIVDDSTGADGHARGDAVLSIHAGPSAVDVAELAVKFLNDGNVGFLADGESAEFGAMNFVGGIHGGAFDEFVERNAHGAELRKDIVITEDGEISRVQVGGDGVGKKTLFDSGNCIAEPEAAGAMADVEDDAAFACFQENGIEFAIGKNDGELLGEDVGVNVAGPGLLEDEVGVSAIGAGPKIEHHGTIGSIAASYGAIDGGPRSVLAIPRFIGPVVGSLHANDEVGIFLDGVGASLDVHFVDILFETTTHSVGNDVKKREDTDGGVIHDALFFEEKGFGAGGTGIDDGGNA